LGVSSEFSKAVVGSLKFGNSIIVFPANAGIQNLIEAMKISMPKKAMPTQRAQFEMYRPHPRSWIPALAGMTSWMDSPFLKAQNINHIFYRKSGTFVRNYVLYAVLDKIHPDFLDLFA
jgi:hypothetical protein